MKSQTTRIARPQPTVTYAERVAALLNRLEVKAGPCTVAGCVHNTATDDPARTGGA